MNDVKPALLVVDDDEANRKLYRAMLKDVGADVHTAADGAAALAECAQQEFAMILLDVRLPDMSGFDVAHRLRTAQPPVDAPIVFVSALHTHEDDAFQGYNVGAVDYLISPVVPAILRAKASVFIRLHLLRRRAALQRAEIETAYRELRSAHGELEQFSYSASHDLRNVLFQVSGYVELLDERIRGRIDPTAKQYLSQLIAATRRMNELIDDLLMLSRMASGQLEPAPVNLSALAREIAEELRTAHPDQRVQWQIADGMHVYGNPGLLRTALTNLLGNAWKYSARSETPRIEVGSLEREDRTVYFVADNGAGFDVEAAGDRLFRPFQRFHSSASFHGSGIGLTIVQRVIVKHGGTIWAESSPGHGARFFFTLPLSAQAHRDGAEGRM